MTRNNENSCVGELSLYDVKPGWNSHSNLINTIMQLEQLKARVLDGTTPPYIFFQLKEIFHRLESLGSGRIEGNRTTLSEFVERVIDVEEGVVRPDDDESLREILNIEEAMRYVEDVIDVDTPIKKEHLLEMHRIIVNGLSPPDKKGRGEGSFTPGEFRDVLVKITESKFCPPDVAQVNEYVEEMLGFINQNVESKDRLLRTAMAHHRFACIHPFDNGNGRVVRVFTYALLLRYGFRVRDKEVEDGEGRIGRILNPTAIFCIDRDRYYKMLSLADSGRREDMLAWCRYVLTGLLGEIKKIDDLLDYHYLKKKILLPAISDAAERRFITGDEYIVLSHMFESGADFLKADDLKSLFGTDDSVKVSRMIKRMRERGILVPIEKNSRRYEISFTNKHLMRSIIGMLEQNGFAPGLS